MIIGTAAVAAAAGSGAFRTAWTVPPGITKARLTILAKQRCTSGKTGRVYCVTRSASLKLKLP